LQKKRFSTFLDITIIVRAITIHSHLTTVISLVT